MAELARGSVTDRPWGLTFGALGVRGLTGELAVDSDGKPYRVAFYQGAVIGAFSPLVSDAAVRVALTSTLITSTQVADITRRMAAAPDREEVELLAELARLTPEQTMRLRRRLLAQRAARAASVERGTFTVSDGITLPYTQGTELDIRAVCYLATKTNYTEDRMGDELERLGGWFKLKPAAVEDLPQFGFGELEKPVLEMLLAGDDLAAIEEAHPTLGARTARAVTYALVSCGACEIRGSSRPLVRGGQNVVARTATPTATPRPSTLAPPSAATNPNASTQRMTPLARVQPVQRVGTPTPPPQPVVERTASPSQSPPPDRPAGSTAPPVGRAGRPTTPPIVDDAVPVASAGSRSGSFPLPGRSGGSTPPLDRSASGSIPISPSSSGPIPVVGRTVTASGGTPLLGRTISGHDTLEPGTATSPVARAKTPTSGPVIGRAGTPSSGPVIGRAGTPSSAPVVGRAGTPSNPAIGRTSSSSSPPLGRARTPSAAIVAGRPSSGSTPPASMRAALPRRAKRDTASTREVDQILAMKLPLLDQRADHFTLLGLPRGASPDEIRQTYYMLARKLHPDRLAAIGVHDEARSAQRVMAEVNAAFAVLNDTAKRADYIALLESGGAEAVEAKQAAADELAMRVMRAEEAFRQGEMALRRDQIQQAVAAFQNAVDLAPNESEYQAMLAWALFAAATDKQAVAIATRKALIKAAEANNMSPTARFYLGRVERMLGREKEALACFHEVLRIKPNHTDAASEARVLEARLKGKR